MVTPTGKNNNKKAIDRIYNAEHSDTTRSKKVTAGGVAIDSAHIYGNNSATAKFVGKCKILRVVNTDAAVQYITFGVAGVGVATITNGAGLEPGKETFFNTGNDEYFRSSNNAVQVVGLLDN